MAINIIFDKNSGGIAEIHTCPEMSFCESEGNLWGTPKCDFYVSFNRQSKMELKESDSDKMSAVFSNGVLDCVCERTFTESGLTEAFTVTNISNNTVFLSDGDFGIYTPFNDSYESADECLCHRCHAHINICGASTAVLALRMGNYTNNLGLALTKGSVSSYSIENPPYAKNDRGNIILNISPFSLAPNESYTLEWIVFECISEEDFNAKRSNIGHTLFEVKAYNLYLGEKIECKLNTEKAEVYINGNKIDTAGGIIDYLPEKEGEYFVEAVTEFGTTSALFYVSVPLNELVENRIKFICEKQQYLKDGSPLDGAYLIYDNSAKSMYYSDFVADHNACRERIGMGILIARWLQNHSNEKVRESLERYIEFVCREMVDTENGNVFDGLGRNPDNLRLYNAPWVCDFFCEVYTLTKETKWATLAFRVMEAYYKNGGDHFYPNAYSPVLPVSVLKKAELSEESDKLLEYTKMHAETIMKNGTDYPKHEVDYEQTIVAPAATILTGLYELTEDKQYLDAAQPHIELLTRFNGHGNDYHLYENSIRHWDDYWFGSARCFGDTFPHYWSVLSGYVFERYGIAVNDTELITRGKNGVRGSLCLFNSDGSASCSYVMPKRINDREGKFFDSWANDQDFALYYALLSEENK